MKGSIWMQGHFDKLLKRGHGMLPVPALIFYKSIEDFPLKEQLCAFMQEKGFQHEKIESV